MKVSVIVPVLHENAGINSFLDHLHDLCGNNDHEIIIVDGSSQQDTLKAVKNCTDNITLLSSQKGRARQMNAGARAARGDILLFLHSDSRLPAGAIEDIRSTCFNPEYAGGAFELKLDSLHIFLRFISWTASLRSRLTRVPFGDQAIFLRADCFKTLGGYREIPLMEDTELMKRMITSGMKISIIHKAVISSARRWEKRGIIRTTFCNHLIRLLYRFGVAPGKLAAMYYGGHDA